MSGRPSIPSGSHPIERASYCIWTPAINSMHNQIESWLKQRATGGLIYGAQRFGKSEAIKFISNLFKDKYGKYAPIYHIPMISVQHFTDNQFFSHFLKYTQHALYQSGTSFVKRQRLINHIVSLANETSNKIAMFFLDEAQQLNELQFQYLVDIQNELKMFRIFSIFFLIGQPELKFVSSALQNSDKMQIVGRFMSRQHEFHGLLNSSEVAYCLEFYDEKMIYPKESGFSYTRYFAPRAFESGWRLRSDAEILWKAFCEIRIRNKIPVKDEIPMEYFTRSVEYLLSEKAGQGFDFKGFSFNQYKEAAIASGYVEGSRYLLRPNM